MSNATSGTTATALASASDQSREKGQIVLSVVDLRKSYGDVKAVDGVSFEVGRGEIFGLLGPNGAGKTTTIEMLEGLQQARCGRRRRVLGIDVAAQPGRSRSGSASSSRRPRSIPS